MSLALIKTILSNIRIELIGKTHATRIIFISATLRKKDLSDSSEAFIGNIDATYSIEHLSSCFCCCDWGNFLESYLILGYG